MKEFDLYQKWKLTDHLTPGISFLSRAFGLWGWVWQSENDGFLKANGVLVCEARVCFLKDYMNWKISDCIPHSRPTSPRPLLLWTFFLLLTILSILLAWWSTKIRQMRWLVHSMYKCRGNTDCNGERVCTFTASNKVLTGSCSWAHGLLKCWRDSRRDLTIKPWTRIAGFISQMEPSNWSSKRK